MADLGELSWYLGIQVAQCQHSVRLTQKTYIFRMLERFGMQDWNLAKLLQLFISRKIAFQREKLNLRRILKDIRASLDLWCMPWSEQDSISLLFWANSRSMYRNLARIILLLLKGFKIPSIFKRSRGKTTEKLSLYGYCDASWGCQEDGFCYRFCFQSFDWTSQLMCKETINNCSIYCWSWVRCSVSCCSGSNLVERFT